MSNLKKFFFFSLFLFFIALLFWGVYIISFKKDGVENFEIPKEIYPKNEEGRDVFSPGKISVVSDEEVISPTISPSGSSLQYFSKNNGKIIQIDLGGKKERNLSSREIYGVIDAFWSVDKNKAIVKTRNSEGNYSFSFFDYKNDFFEELHGNINAVAWQTNADRIFYKFYSPQNKKSSLNVSDPSGKNWKKISDLPHDKFSFYQVPGSGLISVWNNGDAYYPTVFETASLVSGEKKTVYSDGFGADYLWDFSGNKILVSRTDVKGGIKIQLAVMNSNGGEYRNLNVPTFVSKCAWSKDDKNVYYALPGGIPENSVLPNDYKNEKFRTTDTFWKINLETGEKTRLVEVKDMNEKQYDASQIFLNQDESIVFFTNKVDGKLYKIVLP
jgi:hypothetical protein